MEVKENPAELIEKIKNARETINDVIETYFTDGYADCGWDNFAESLNSVMGQLYMLEKMLKNARIKMPGYNPLRWDSYASLERAKLRENYD